MWDRRTEIQARIMVAVFVVTSVTAGVLWVLVPDSREIMTFLLP